MLSQEEKKKNNNLLCWIKKVQRSSTWVSLCESGL